MTPAQLDQPRQALYFDDLQPVRARRTDPATSQRAASKAAQFANSHAGRIVESLRTFGKQTTLDIARTTGLTVVQVDRRKSDLERAGLVKVVDTAGDYSVFEAV
jgi:hypothetical protein